MKSVFKILPVVAAVAALSFSTSALAGNDHYDNHDHGDSVDLHINKDIDLSVDYEVKGKTTVTGTITPNQNGLAITKTDQKMDDVKVKSKGVDNDASIKDNSFSNASGNQAVNVGAGQGFAQSNALSLAILPLNAANKASLDAESFINQKIEDGKAYNKGGNDKATIKDNAFKHSTGVIGVNVGAGQLFEQSNALTIADGTPVMSTTTAVTTQVLDDLKIKNSDLDSCYGNNGYHNTDPSASIKDYAFSNASGNISVNVGAGQGFMQSNSTVVAN